MKIWKGITISYVQNRGFWVDPDAHENINLYSIIQFLEFNNFIVSTECSVNYLCIKPIGNMIDFEDEKIFHACRFINEEIEK